MKRIKLVVQYKGTHYHGWQVQPNGITVQEILQKTLSKILNQKVTVIGASRTDSGVHAMGQVCHFDHNSPSPPLNPSTSLRTGLRGGRGALPQLLLGLNSLLPSDIAVSSVQPVSPTFHAQKSARKKIYEYRILNSSVRSPFLHEYSWQIPHPLNVGKMRQAAKFLVGKHDFSAFCASGSSVKTTMRRVYWVKIVASRLSLVASQSVRNFKRPATSNQQLVTISITGSGFLKQMVRNIVGTLTDIGRGKIPPTEVKKILKSRDRKKAGPTAPAKGLFLKKVIY